MNRLQLPARGDQLVSAQPRQMLRNRRHAEPYGLVQSRHRPLALQQLAQIIRRGRLAIALSSFSAASALICSSSKFMLANLDYFITYKSSPFWNRPPCAFVVPLISCPARRPRRLRGRHFRRASDRCRRPESCRRDGRTGSSACRAGPHWRHHRLPRDQGRGMSSQPALRSPLLPTRSSPCRCRRWIPRSASQQSQRDQAKADFDRVAELQKRGVSTQTQLDQARTNLDVAERNLAAMRRGSQRDRPTGERGGRSGAGSGPGL